MSRDYGLEAQQAAELHLEQLWAAEQGDRDYADVDVDPLAPFCGCETCVIREVLNAAWPLLLEAAKRDVHDEVYSKALSEAQMQARQAARKELAEGLVVRGDHVIVTYYDHPDRARPIVHAYGAYGTRHAAEQAKRRLLADNDAEIKRAKGSVYVGVRQLIDIKYAIEADEQDEQ